MSRGGGVDVLIKQDVSDALLKVSVDLNEYAC
jgi:hypothetical protein